MGYMRVCVGIDGVTHGADVQREIDEHFSREDWRELQEIAGEKPANEELLCT